MSKLEEMSFDVDCDWDGLKKILDEAPKSMEYIEYKGAKWIKEDFCIPKQYIQEKIEELNREYDDFLEFDREDDAQITSEIIGILEELNKVTAEEDIKELPELTSNINYDTYSIENNRHKINELVRAVNKMRKNT